jgi:succinate dehydrogenase flavin-adding protein (antitoxin of CptAB toxin-antitoxin module)
MSTKKEFFTASKIKNTSVPYNEDVDEWEAVIEYEDSKLGSWITGHPSKEAAKDFIKKQKKSIVNL